MVCFPSVLRKIGSGHYKHEFQGLMGLYISTNGGGWRTTAANISPALQQPSYMVDEFREQKMEGRVKSSLFK
jgi:hypothetical protein